MEPYVVPSAVYAIFSIVGIVFIGLLAWAPMKLYAISRELKLQTEQMRTQTRLLAAIANAADPVEEQVNC